MNESSGKDPRKAQPIPGYDILERISAGGMGTVFRARQLSMDRIVALKVLRKTDLKDALPLDRLRREALLIARMDHPNIVKGIDMGETDRYYYFAMDFIEGRSVKDLLELHGPFDEYEATRIVRDVAKALSYAGDQKLTHRDIKPGNILISKQGLTKVTDLGLAKGESDLTITREGTTVGTPQYISPEQARNPETADIRSDIFSLGATYYHMVTGRMPFAGDSMAQVLTKVLFERPPLPEEVRPGTSPGTSRVIARMMAKDPAKRYQTPGDLLDDLDVLIEALKDGSRELAAFIGMNWKDSQQGGLLHRKKTVLGAVALVVLFLALFIFTRNSDAPKPPEPVSKAQALLASYDAGEVKPSEALKRLRRLPPGSADEVASFKEQVHEDIRRIMNEVVRPGSLRYTRALLEGGSGGSVTRFKRFAQFDVQEALGGGIGGLPPELQSYWREKIDEGAARVLEKYGDLLLAVDNEAQKTLDERTSALQALLGAGAYHRAWAGTETLETGAEDLYKGALETIAATLISADASRTVDPSSLLDDDALKRFSKEVRLWCDAFKEQIAAAGKEAQSVFLVHVEREAVRLVAEGDPDLIVGGVDGVIARAVEAVKMRPPQLPPSVEVERLDALKEGLGARLEEKKTALDQQRHLAFRQARFQEIDPFLSQGDLSGALRHIEATPSSSGEERAYLDRWKTRIEALASIEASALEGLGSFKGLEAVLKTERGARYSGTITRVSSETGAVELALGSGRVVELAVKNLAARDVLLWCGKVRVLEPWLMGLYGYCRGEQELAEQYLSKAGDFPEAGLFLDRIGAVRVQAETDRAETNQALVDLLDRAEQALQVGDVERGLSLLDEARNNYRSAPAWTSSRRRREALRKGLGALQQEKARQERLARLFSVPVEVLEGDRVRVIYPFDSVKELDDFTAYGKEWHVLRGLMACGADVKEEKPDFFHNQVGIRVGEAFDPGEAMTVSFSYRPPVGAQQPVFMVLSFFGGCFGIRSLSGGDGQVNFWQGDPDEYWDHFFVPELGESKPRKGRVQAFGFQRGEAYTLEVRWTPGRELLLSIDDRDIYRAKAFKPDRSGFEVKTLRRAEIDDLALEGTLR